MAIHALSVETPHANLVPAGDAAYLFPPKKRGVHLEPRADRIASCMELYTTQDAALADDQGIDSISMSSAGLSTMPPRLAAHPTKAD
jgi:hypothetical protein